jgi:hypothetical protein
MKTLVAGQLLTYNTAPARDGRSKAVNLRLLDPERLKRLIHLASSSRTRSHGCIARRRALSRLGKDGMLGNDKREDQMATAERQMPEHIGAAYRDAVDNIIFLKRQQWVATNYALIVYAAIFIISAQYFSRTDFARNTLGIPAIAASRVAA